MNRAQRRAEKTRHQMTDEERLEWTDRHVRAQSDLIRLRRRNWAGDATVSAAIEACEEATRAADSTHGRSWE